MMKQVFTCTFLNGETHVMIAETKVEADAAFNELGRSIGSLGEFLGARLSPTKAEMLLADIYGNGTESFR